MSIRSPITQTMRWYRYEDKTLDFTILDTDGDPVDLSGVDLSWRVLREAGSATVLYEKESPDITVMGADNNVARIEVEADEYDDLPAGIHYHVLWDRTNNLLLAEGEAWLNDAADPNAT